MAAATPPARTSDSQVALRARALTKRYDALVAVDGIDLDIERGECFGLLGPNGAGKTTAIEMLEGLTPADAGEMEVLGQRWGDGDDRALRERLGIQLQETRLADKLTVEEVVRLFRSLYARGRDPGEVIALLELEAKRATRVHKLSGGQRQRLALACALVSDPDILFLDEPTTGLDPQARLRIWEVVERFCERGGTTLLTTHYMDEAARLCDRVAIMDHGKLIALGTPPSLIDALGADEIIDFECQDSIDRSTLGQLPGVATSHRRGGHLVLHTDRVGHTLPALLVELERQGTQLKSIATHRATLEDVYVHLTGRELRDE